MESSDYFFYNLNQHAIPLLEKLVSSKRGCSKQTKLLLDKFIYEYNITAPKLFEMIKCHRNHLIFQQNSLRNYGKNS